MKLSLLSVASLLAAVGAYSVNDLSDSVNCRAGPNTTTAVVKQYSAGESIDIKCQTSGQRVYDYAIWDKTGDDCYISDYYVETGVHSNYVTKDCLYRGPVPGRTVDDYRFKTECDSVDPWAYYACQCVSFVAQRINERQRIYFTNRYKGQTWGNANEWVAAAHNSPNVTVDTTPVPGCIAQHSRSKLGHVAWVHSVDYKRKQMTIEQYNVIPFKYSKETVAWDAFDYFIHLDCKH